MLRRCASLLLLVAPLFLMGADASVSRPPPGYPTELPWPGLPDFRFQRGDDPRWAAKDFDDSGWQPISGRELPSRDGIYWVRWRVTQRHPPPFRPLDGLIFKVVASYDVYWDGHLI